MGSIEIEKLKTHPSSEPGFLSEPGFTKSRNQRYERRLAFPGIYRFPG